MKNARHGLVAAALFILAGMMGVPIGLAQTWSPPVYPATNVSWNDIWVGPTGNDTNSGVSSNLPLRSITAAWGKIPANVMLTNKGYRVRILPGVYTNNTPGYWENRQGSANAPIWFKAEGTNWSAVLSDIAVFNCAHLYFQGIHFSKSAPGGDGMQVEQGRHILLRDCKISGRNLVQEGLKVNQSQHIYVERCDISGAGDNALDFVAVQYGHIINSRIYGAGDWVMYVKGGSAYILIDGNEVFNSSGNGGITAGQGTGFEWMTNPWLHYEAYDVKIVNNYIHDTFGAGLGVNGGYNILVAHNTCIRVGRRSHIIEVVHGSRSCDGNTSACESNRIAGGWGWSNDESNTQFIPNRNIYIFNNIVYNPGTNQSQWQHFDLREGMVPPAGSNVGNPSRADQNLLIRGNIIWNGPPNHSIGGCGNTTGTCHDALIASQNYINLFEPQFVNAASNDWRPRIEGNLFAALSYPIPAFPGGDRPAVPVTPGGLLDNQIVRDRTGFTRLSTRAIPGAYSGGASVRFDTIDQGHLSVEAETAYRYRIEQSSNLSGWNVLATVTSVASTASVSITNHSSAVFYRAILLP